MDLGKNRLSGIDWIVLAQNREQWEALVNMVIKLRDP
jgi:hypothetical protein